MLRSVLTWLTFSFAHCPKAEPITITNAGFETTTGFKATPIPNNTFYYKQGVIITDWDLYDPAGIAPEWAEGVTNPSGGNTFHDPIFGDSAPEGFAYGYVDQTDSKKIGRGSLGIQQTLSSVITAHTTYTLSVYIGNSDDNCFSRHSQDPGDNCYEYPGFPGYKVQLMAGTEYIELGADDNTLSINEGQWALSTVTYTTSGADSNIGKALVIRLMNKNEAIGQAVTFDDVQLTAEITTMSTMAATTTMPTTAEITTMPTMAAITSSTVMTTKTTAIITYTSMTTTDAPIIPSTTASTATSAISSTTLTSSTRINIWQTNISLASTTMDSTVSQIQSPAEQPIKTVILSISSGLFAGILIFLAMLICHKRRKQASQVDIVDKLKRSKDETSLATNKTQEIGQTHVEMVQDEGKNHEMPYTNEGGDFTKPMDEGHTIEATTQYGVQYSTCIQCGDRSRQKMISIDGMFVCYTCRILSSPAVDKDVNEMFKCKNDKPTETSNGKTQTGIAETHNIPMINDKQTMGGYETHSIIIKQCVDCDQSKPGKIYDADGLFYCNECYACY